MAEPLIVLIDSENRIVKLYGKYTREIPFAFAFILPSLLNGEDILYISGVEKAMGEDVINLLAQMITTEDSPKERLFIRSKQEGYVRAPEVKLTFNGPKDAKPIDTYGWDLFERSETLRRWLAADKIEILTESEATALRKKRPDPKSKDKALDEIILKGKVDDLINSEDMFGPGEGDGDLISSEDDKDEISENEAILRSHSNWGKDRQKKE